MDDLQVLHDHFMKTNFFFLNVAKTKTIQDMHKIYQFLLVKEFNAGHLLCEYGAEGHEFFIILKGEASIEVPVQSNDSLNSLADVMSFVCKNFKKILTYNDRWTR
jgi:hypothetical protein